MRENQGGTVSLRSRSLTISKNSTFSAALCLSKYLVCADDQHPANTCAMHSGAFPHILHMMLFTLVTRRPYCPGRPKKLCFTTLSLAMETMGMRLSVVKQSLFGPPGQYGRRVTRANSDQMYPSCRPHRHALVRAYYYYFFIFIFLLLLLELSRAWQRSFSKVF